jgi:DNA-binding protein H-NS
MSARKLVALQKKIPAALSEVKDKRHDSLLTMRETMKAFFDETGYKPRDLFPHAPIVPKYKHPDSDKAWTGRGKQPQWVRDYVATHGSVDSLANPNHPKFQQSQLSV